MEVQTEGWKDRQTDKADLGMEGANRQVEIGMEVQTEGWRDRQTDRQAGRQAGSQPDRQTDD